MVTLNQLESGVSRWLDKELMPKLPRGGAYDGLKKAATVAVAMYAIKQGRSALEMLTRNPFMATIGAVNEEGEIDIEGFAEEMRKQIPEKGLTMDVPMIGELTIYREDLDDMLRCIKGREDERR